MPFGESEVHVSLFMAGAEFGEVHVPTTKPKKNNGPEATGSCPFLGPLWGVKNQRSFCWDHRTVDFM